MNKATKKAIQAFYYLHKFREECESVGSVVCVRQTYSNIEWLLFYAIREMMGNEDLCMPDILRLAESCNSEVWK